MENEKFRPDHIYKNPSRTKTEIKLLLHILSTQTLLQDNKYTGRRRINRTQLQLQSSDCSK